MGAALWRRVGFSLQGLLLWQRTDSRELRLQEPRCKGSASVAPRFQGTGLTAVAHRLSGSEARGIFPDRDQAMSPALASGFFITEQVDSLPNLAGGLYQTLQLKFVVLIK